MKTLGAPKGARRRMRVLPRSHKNRFPFGQDQKQTVKQTLRKSPRIPFSTSRGGALGSPVCVDPVQTVPLLEQCSCSFKPLSSPGRKCPESGEVGPGFVPWASVLGGKAAPTQLQPLGSNAGIGVPHEVKPVLESELAIQAEPEGIGYPLCGHPPHPQLLLHS